MYFLFEFCAVMILMWTRVSDLGIFTQNLITNPWLSEHISWKLALDSSLLILVLKAYLAYDDNILYLSGFQWGFISMIWMLHTLRPLLLFFLLLWFCHMTNVCLNWCDDEIKTPRKCLWAVDKIIMVLPWASLKNDFSFHWAP